MMTALRILASESSLDCCENTSRTMWTIGEDEEEEGEVVMEKVVVLEGVLPEGMVLQGRRPSPLMGVTVVSCLVSWSQERFNTPMVT